MECNKKDNNFIYGLYLTGFLLLGMFVGDNIQGFNIDGAITFFQNLNMRNIALIIICMSYFIVILTVVVMNIKNENYFKTKEIVITELGITLFETIGVSILILFNII